jgi:hypothetical protein
MSVVRYGPEQTRYWSTRELGALIEKDVALSFLSDTPFGGSRELGRVADAGIGRFGQAWVEFADGKSAAWSRGEVSVTVFVEEA